MTVAMTNQQKRFLKSQGINNITLDSVCEGCFRYTSETKDVKVKLFFVLFEDFDLIDVCVEKNCTVDDMIKKGFYLLSIEAITEITNY